MRLPGCVLTKTAIWIGLPFPYNCDYSDGAKHASPRSPKWSVTYQISSLPHFTEEWTDVRAESNKAVSEVAWVITMSYSRVGYQIKKFQDSACQILKFQYFACQILTFQDSACQILKFQYFASQILNFKILHVKFWNFNMLHGLLNSEILKFFNLLVINSR